MRDRWLVSAPFFATGPWTNVSQPLLGGVPIFFRAVFAQVVVAAFHFHGLLVGCAVFLSLAAGHQNYKQNKDKQQLLTDLDKVGRARRKPDIQISTG